MTTSRQQNSRELLADIVSVESAARKLRCSMRGLYHLIEEGRVPFVAKCGRRWIMTSRSLDFLAAHYSKPQRKKMRAKAGMVARLQMAAEAAKLDPACAERAARHVPQWWTRKAALQNPKSKPRK